MSVRIDKTKRRRLATWACFAALLASIAGCERRSGEATTPAFVPSWAEARQALELSLSAWRDTPTPSPASLNIPSVQFVDKRRLNHRLLSFQVLGQTDLEYVRQFTVRLIIEGDESPQLVRYNVLARDPVWVYRLEDYEMISHWEHDMPEPALSEQPKADETPPSAN